MNSDPPDSGRDPQAGEPTGERSAQLPPPSAGGRAVAGTAPAPPAGGPSDTDVSEAAHRPSLLDALAHSRTTWHEVGEVAQRLSLLAPGLADARKAVRQAALSLVVGLTLAMLIALVFAGGTPRLVLGILGGAGAATLAVFVALRTVSKLAARRGARPLPGPAWLWVGAVLCFAVATTAGLTLSVWRITKPATATSRSTEAPPRRIDSAATLPSAESARADADMKRGQHVGMHHGVLYVPPTFESTDGQFDLVIHYHGNVELIEQSVAAAQVNALVLILNLGDGAGSYGKPLRNPYAFDILLETVEARAGNTLGLRSAQIRRVALSSWSAGFAALSQILSSPSRFYRVDAVLLMDSLHASFAPGGKTGVHTDGLKPFIDFARRAASGQKLMVLTHSAIETRGYPSTTQTADALLQELALERQPAAPDAASPPAVDLKVAKWAFPPGERHWLQVVSRAEQQSLHVYGCSGNGKGDHIAHLAQMSVTVLPLLRERWR